MSLFNKLRTFLLMSSLFLFIFLLHILSNWWVFRVTGIRGKPNFADLDTVLNTNSCFQQIGLKLYDSTARSACSGGGYGGYMYGVLLQYILEFFRINAAYVQIIGISIVLLLSLTLAFIACTYHKGETSSFFLSLLLLSSPGIWLLAERGNIDAFILFLLVLACINLSRKNDYIALIMIGITALLKFYTLPLLLLYPLISSDRRKRTVSLIAFTVIFPIVIWNYSLVESFPSSWFVSFGSPVGFKYLETIGIILNPKVSLVLGALLVFLTATLLQRIFIARKIEPLNNGFPPLASRDLGDLLIMVFGATFTMCYFAGTNFDYRLTFLAIMGFGLIARVTVSQGTQKTLLALLLMSLWCSDFFFGIRANYLYTGWQFLGDIAVGIFEALFLIAILQSNTKFRATF